MAPALSNVASHSSCALCLHRQRRKQFSILASALGTDAESSMPLLILSLHPSSVDSLHDHIVI